MDDSVVFGLSIFCFVMVFTLLLSLRIFYDIYKRVKVFVDIINKFSKKIHPFHFQKGVEDELYNRQ